MKYKQTIASLLLFALFVQFSLLPAHAQQQQRQQRLRAGDPIEITFGKPNIWSLEQAHYLLSQMHERSLGIKAKALTQLDPNDVNAVRLNLIRQMFGLAAEVRQSPELQVSTSAKATPTPLQSPVPFPSPVTEPSPLTGTVIEKLLGNPDFLKKLFGDAKLNATTQLDNHIQLQYEIIAKQLTLLRDEVGPDERLVFLELPQSIYSSPGKADNKVAQVYWQVNAYSERDNSRYIATEIRRIISEFPNFPNSINPNQRITTPEELSNNILALRRRLSGNERDINALKKLIKDTKKIIEDKECAENSTRECAAANDALLQHEHNLERDEFQNEQLKDELARKQRIFANLGELERTLNRIKLQQVDDDIERLNQRGMPRSQETIDQLRSSAVVTNLMKDRSAGNRTLNAARQAQTETVGNYLELRTVEDNSHVRTVDIIPRQSSLNVNDIQETVKSTVISAAFSFLFGLGARTNYQRQTEQYEQYVHQELYASGFGKGDRLFGWTFGPVPGTKRIAPGIRTTYAVMIVPRKAESLVISAKGCYFPRKARQPKNVMDTTGAQQQQQQQDDSDDDGWAKNNKRECTQTSEPFILQIPNGGDAQGFWLTSIDYSPVRKGSQRLVASINGRNFTQQVGVLIDGVPLQQVVELTRKLPDRELLDDFCRNGICGAYEVVDSNEITIAFQMPEDYKGTPEITVIGPGRSVSVNRLRLSRIQAGGSVFPDISLTDDKIPLMFGARTRETLSIGDLTILGQAAAPANSLIALLTGTKFERGFDEILVNGAPVNASTFLSPENYNLNISPATGDAFTVMVRRCRDKDGKLKDLAKCDTSEAVRDKIEALVKSFPIAAAQFAVTNATAVTYDKKSNVMFIRVEGIGLSKAKLIKVNDKDLKELPSGSGEIPVSARELLVRVSNPDSVVKITLGNQNQKEISTVVIRPIDETAERIPVP